MNVTHLVPMPVFSEPFRRDRQRHIPQISGCYALTTVAGHILYLGLATTLGQRFEQHLDTPSKVAPTVEGRAVLFHWLATEERDATERGWLNAHRVVESRLPLLNKLDSPVSC